MKTLLNIFISIILLSMGTQAFAGETNMQFNITNSGEKSFSLYLDNIPEGKVTISLQSQYGFTLHKEVIQELTQYAKIYNLDQLEAGAYELLIENEQKTWIQPIWVNNKRLHIDFDKQQEIYHPVITTGEEFVQVSMLQTEPKKISVFMADSKGNELFEESVRHDGSYNRRFNISALPEGVYYINIYTRQKSFRKSFAVQ